MHVRERLTKICDSFMGKNFEIPPGADQAEMVRTIQELEKRIVDAR